MFLTCSYLFPGALSPSELVSFMTTRDEKMQEKVKWHKGWIQEGKGYKCPQDTAHKLYSAVIATLIQVAFKANPCIQVMEALGMVSRAPVMFTPCGDNCKYSLECWTWRFNWLKLDADWWSHKWTESLALLVSSPVYSLYPNGPCAYQPLLLLHCAAVTVTLLRTIYMCPYGLCNLSLLSRFFPLSSSPLN